MIEYPAKIYFDKVDKCFLVEFIDLPGCQTYGQTQEEAISNAVEALSGYLETIDSRKLPIPHPSKHKGENIYYIKPEKNVSFAIWLRKKRLEKGYTQKQVAHILKISYQSYQRYENPSKSNPTLKTIAKLEEVLKENLIKV